MSDGESPKRAVAKAAYVDELVRSVVDSFERHYGPLEECEATLRRYLPDWDGKYTTVEDLARLSKQVETKFGEDISTMPKDLGKVLAGLLIGRFSGPIVDAVSTNLSGLDPVEAATKVWQIFTTSVDAKRKGGAATAQWTVEVDEKAREIFAELKRSRMKDTPAYNRTAVMLRELGFDFSQSTVRRHLKDSNA